MSPPTPDAHGLRVALVAARFNDFIVASLVKGARAAWERHGGAAADLSLVYVPGAFELPLVVQEVAAKGGIDGVIALGVIIQGQTAHAELVARSVTESLQRIGLNHRVPVIHEVLLLQNEEQARVRCLEDELNRGTEAARVAMRMAQVMGDFARR